MAPVSVLPGRVRFESMSLIGQEGICNRLEREVLSTEGVLRASASCRTGRLLVIFNPQIVSHELLAKRIENVLSACIEDKVALPVDYARKNNGTGSFSPQLAGELMVDLVAHTILPKPLDFLIPAAISLFRGGRIFNAYQGVSQ